MTDVSPCPPDCDGRPIFAGQIITKGNVHTTWCDVCGGWRHRRPGILKRLWYRLMGTPVGDARTDGGRAAPRARCTFVDEGDGLPTGRIIHTDDVSSLRTDTRRLCVWYVAPDDTDDTPSADGEYIPRSVRRSGGGQGGGCPNRVEDALKEILTVVSDAGLSPDDRAAVERSCQRIHATFGGEHPDPIYPDPSAVERTPFDGDTYDDTPSSDDSTFPFGALSGWPPGSRFEAMCAWVDANRDRFSQGATLTDVGVEDVADGIVDAVQNAEFTDDDRYDGDDDANVSTWG